MSQNNSDQGQAAETPAQETKTFIRQVRAATRRKYAPEDKIRIVLEGPRREGIKQASSMPGPRNSWKRGKSGSPGTR